MINEEKKKLRIEYRAARAKISGDEKQKKDFAITGNLLTNEVYTKAQEVLCYVSTGNEIDTRGIILDALRCGKRVFVPKCTEQKGVMKFCRINSFDDLCVGKYGISEPINTADDNEWQQSDEASVCIVPTLCCDRLGNRLGYGGGYYDRFLNDFNGKTVCLCYSQFSQAEIPLEEHDVPCDIIISD